MDFQLVREWMTSLGCIDIESPECITRSPPILAVGRIGKENIVVVLRPRLADKRESGRVINCALRLQARGYTVFATTRADRYYMPLRCRLAEHGIGLLRLTSEGVIEELYATFHRKKKGYAHPLASACKLLSQ